MGCLIFAGLVSSGEGSFLGSRGTTGRETLVRFRCGRFLLLDCASWSEPEDVKTGVLHLVLGSIVLFVLRPAMGGFCCRDCNRWLERRVGGSIVVLVGGYERWEGDWRSI